MAKPPLLTRIDQLILPEYRYLNDGDECYFLREYTSKAGFAYSDTNDLISNLKKTMDRRGQSGWGYKDRAISRIANELRNAINPEWLESATLVPVPPSKAKSDPLYDDRMLKILRELAPIRPLDIRELIVQIASTEAAHAGNLPRNPNVIAKNYRIDESCTAPAPTIIGLFDDVLTTGSHFRASCKVLRERFPDVALVGIFVARRVFPPSESIP